MFALTSPTNYYRYVIISAFFFLCPWCFYALSVITFPVSHYDGTTLCNYSLLFAYAGENGLSTFWGSLKNHCWSSNIYFPLFHVTGLLRVRLLKSIFVCHLGQRRQKTWFMTGALDFYVFQSAISSMLWLTSLFINPECCSCLCDVGKASIFHFISLRISVFHKFGQHGKEPPLLHKFYLEKHNCLCGIFRNGTVFLFG